MVIVVAGVIILTVISLIALAIIINLNVNHFSNKNSLNEINNRVDQILLRQQKMHIDFSKRFNDIQTMLHAFHDNNSKELQSRNTKSSPLKSSKVNHGIMEEIKNDPTKFMKNSPFPEMPQMPRPKISSIVLENSFFKIEPEDVKENNENITNKIG